MTRLISSRRCNSYRVSASVILHFFLHPCSLFFLLQNCFAIYSSTALPETENLIALSTESYFRRYILGSSPLVSMVTRLIELLESVTLNSFSPVWLQMSNLYFYIIAGISYAKSARWWCSLDEMISKLIVYNVADSFYTYMNISKSMYLYMYA